MSKRMLIDATHKEETRVAVVENNKLIEFDYESSVRKQLKGSIFLAKVTRVEPSLQAAFVNFGGNRHGFLPFSEIHPDYFRIPVSDREALIAEQEQDMAAEEEAEEAEDEGEAADADMNDNGDDDEEEVVELGGELPPRDESEDDTDENNQDNKDKSGKQSGRRGGRGRGKNKAENAKRVETVGGDVAENEKPKRPALRRNYKIQEVVKRGQIMLIQVSKEERGNKGAAVTSYLSLPGRYCVLMPNSPRAGGVSRKIASQKDRKRMRDLLKDLSVPKGMSVILRTAGVQRSKPEIKRDLEYLTRLWDEIRETTLKSTAPALIHEEGTLIRRTIRDIYTSDVEEILVSGDDGYKFARNFMKTMIPSHVRRVKQYKDDRMPLFHRYQVESQIAEIGETQVTLSSGGYLVINPTEALVSIDVNSGRATKERHIEETALRTNMESAEEVARQLRLRDLGGLVVIDFIDMEDRRNNRKVEQKLKQALSNDRARIQVGRISSFGLLELSRQRLNPSLTEAQFETCPHCRGRGVVRTTDSAAIAALRALEEEGIRARATEVALKVSPSLALYILNYKRHMIADIESRYGFTVLISIGEDFPPDVHEIELLQSGTPEAGDQDNSQDNSESDSKEPPAQSQNDQKSRSDNSERGNGNGNGNGDDEEGENRSRRRRRGRRGGRRRNRNRDGDAQSNNDADSAKPDPDKSRHDNSDSGEQDTKADQGNKAVEKEANEKENDEKKSAEIENVAKESDKKDAVKKSSSPSKKEKADMTGRKKADDKDADKKTDKEDEKKDSKSDKKEDEKKPAAKKTAAKKPAAKKKTAAKKADEKDSDAANDSQPNKDYEVVNATPEKKKKGWWNKMLN